MWSTDLLVVQPYCTRRHRCKITFSNINVFQNYLFWEALHIAHGFNIQLLFLGVCEVYVKLTLYMNVPVALRAALGEPEVMLPKERRGVNGHLKVRGRHAIDSPLEIRRQFSKLPPKQQHMDSMFIGQL